MFLHPPQNERNLEKNVEPGGGSMILQVESTSLNALILILISVRKKIHYEGEPMYAQLDDVPWLIIVRTNSLFEQEKYIFGLVLVK